MMIENFVVDNPRNLEKGSLVYASPFPLKEGFHYRARSSEKKVQPEKRGLYKITTAKTTKGKIRTNPQKLVELETHVLLISTIKQNQVK